MNMIFIAAVAVSLIATFILSAYFFREYVAKRLRASLAWAVGLLLYALAQTTRLYTEVFGEMTAGKPTLVAGLLVTAIAVILFYYGTSLLFFEKGSFFREKMTGIITVVFFALVAYFGLTYPLEGFKDAVMAPMSLIVIMLPKIAIAVLFYRVAANLVPGDFRRKILFLISAGWGLDSVNAFYTGLFTGISPITDSANQVLHAVAWIIILYSMIQGKVTRT